TCALPIYAHLAPQHQPVCARPGTPHGYRLAAPAQSRRRRANRRFSDRRHAPGKLPRPPALGRGRVQLEAIQAGLDRAVLTGKLDVNLRGSRPNYRLTAKVKGMKWQSGKVDAD